MSGKPLSPRAAVALEAERAPVRAKGLRTADAGIGCDQCAVGIASHVGHGGHCHFIQRECQPGDTLYREGDEADTVWVVQRGRVMLRRAGPSSDEAHAHAVRTSGDFLGLEALVVPRYADTAQVLQPSQICGARREHVDRWLGAPTTPARAALEQTLRTFVAEAPRAASSDGTAVRRVARWLVAEAQGEQSPAVPKRALADLLGMVPETLSRALSELRRSGAIGSTRQRRIQILNHEILRAAAQ
jgi:CRP/FNR family transcriptional regulator